MTSSYRNIATALVTVLAASSACARSTPDGTGSVSSGVTLAIRDVTVIPMDRERAIPGQTVLIAGERIVRIGPSGDTPVPPGTRIVDGAGQYLIPGLADMHIHLSPDTGASAARNRRRLGLLVANGVTTARSMLGHPSHFALRDSVRARRAVGPALVLASPQMTGPNASGYFAQFSVRTAEEARQRVREHRQAGYDALKVTFGWTPETYQAIVDEARVLGFPVTGHVPSGIPLEQALRAGQQIEHLDAYLEASVPADAPVRTIESQGGPGPVVRHVRADLADRAAAATVRAGIYNTPTLALFRLAFTDSLDEAALRALPGAEYFPPAAADGMLAQRRQFFADGPPPDERRALRDFRDDLVRRLVRAGAPIMVGSDAPQQMLMVGFGTHRELAALVEAGLTPYQALAAATRTPAEYLGRAGRSGVVAAGATADLVLLERNPLSDIRASSGIRGVVVRGAWLDRGALDALLAAGREP